MSEVAEKPTVDVWMITYNHEPFIAQAIESVLMQQTNFPYRLVIGEDCSTDRTREICIDYKKRFPGKIHLLLNKKNLGGQLNSYNVHKECTAKYVALLEGDDYWTDPLKLQKQVDFLEKNQDYSLCFHKMEYRNTIDNKISFFPEKLAENIMEIEAVLNFPTTGWFAMTSSVIFRKGAIPVFPKWFLKIKSGDCATVMLASLKGKIAFIDEDWGTYRKNAGGIMQTSSYSNINVSKAMYLLFNYFNKHSDYKFEKIIYKQVLIFLYELVLFHKNNSNIFQYFLNTLRFNYYSLQLKENPQTIKGNIISGLNYIRFIFNEVNTK